MHSVERTSPKGQPFVGVCVLCGQEGLTILEAMGTNCPGSARSYARFDALPIRPTDEVLLAAIEGRDSRRDPGEVT